jgi:regulatory protein
MPASTSTTRGEASVGDQPFRDAETWLAERGVRRDPLRVPTEPPGASEPGSSETVTTGVDDAPTGPAVREAGEPPDAPHVAETVDQPEGGPGHEPPPMTAREAARLAASSADETLRRADEALGASAEVGAPRLEDEVADAVAFVRRSTAGTPQAEGRLTEKLRERGWPEAVVAQAMERCRRGGMVDDAAMAAALVDEGRRKGHAPLRLRSDLRRRGLDDDTIERALAPTAAEDPEAVAFAVARDKADSLTGVEAETAFRRIVGHLARRGHPEALARKVARAAVFDARDAQRIAGH